MSSEEDEELYGPAGTSGGAGGDDATLPKVVINKMMKESLSPNVRISNDARELITQCATQFIHLLSSEANEICEKKHNKRTIAPEHAFTALENLGFGTMVKEGTNALNEYKSAVAKKRRKSHRLENLGIPVEELLKQQQELFAKAREEAFQKEQEEYKAAMAAAEASAAAVASNSSSPPGTTSTKADISERPLYYNPTSSMGASYKRPPPTM